MHANARLTFYGRVLLVTRVRIDERTIAHVARELGIFRQCGSRWVARYAQVLQARLDEQAGPEVLAVLTGVAARTITRILRRHQVPRLADCDPVTGTLIRATRGSGRRYEHPEPGDLVHVDVKKLGSTAPPATPRSAGHLLGGLVEPGEGEAAHLTRSTRQRVDRSRSDARSPWASAR